MSRITGTKVLQHFTLWPVLFWLSVSTAVADTHFPDIFPATPATKIRGCSSSQTAYLQEAWRLAHFYAWKADRTLQHIKKQHGAERIYLWNLDFQTDVNQSTSPRTFFGSYNSKRFAYIEDAVQEAVRRFEMRAHGAVKKIRTLRCGQPIAAKQNEHTDVCPAHGTGGNQPGAYHAAAGVIVTCPTFWNDANNQFVARDVRLRNSAKTLVHEVFHWLSIRSRYISDLHGGHYRKGADDVAYLGRKKADWAIHNNDNYAYFIRNVGSAEPFYSGVWLPKRQTNRGDGAFYIDLTWERLEAKWLEYSPNQYLTSVTTYVKDGQRRYAAVWRVGDRSGALYAGLNWHDFAEKFNQLKHTQNLIDVEVYKVGNDFQYLGVWRYKKPGAQGDGGLLNFLSWDDLVAKWNELNEVEYLRDVETYVRQGKRLYVGVWLPGKANAHLFRTPDWNAFSELKQDNNNSAKLIDFERYLTGDGRWWFLGVWRTGHPSGPLERRLNVDDMFGKWNSNKHDHILMDIEVFRPLPTRIR